LARRLRLVVDVGALQRRDGFLILPKSHLQYRDALEPCGVSVTQFVDAVICSDRIGKTERPLLQTSARDSKAFALPSPSHRLRVRIDDGRISLKPRGSSG